jgi:glycosyltransferase involved in cell wall biosynthesis
MKVLLSAYACEPGKGSEPAVGWNSVCQAARFHEVWVITRTKNRSSIEASLAAHPMPKVHWVYFDLPGWSRFTSRGSASFHPYHRYYLWQLSAYLIARKIHREVGFDLVHHVTFVNYWMASFLALLPVPFIWGPVGGGESPPRAFRPSFSLRGRIYEILRDLAQTSGEFDPFVRLTARRAAVGLATTEETAARLRALGCRKVRVLSQVGLPSEEILRLGGFPIRQSEPFRLVSVGDLLHLKGFELGLRAFARLRSKFPACEYWIIGDGPERKRLVRVAGELDLASSVKFWGAMPRWQVLEKLGECDVLVHPSLHDSGGWVCVEAMAAGRPVTCLDLGGPALQVTPETGIKLPATSPQQAVHDLALAMERLAFDPELRARMAQASRKRAREQFNWDDKGDHLNALYSELVQLALPTAAQVAHA